MNKNDSDPIQYERIKRARAKRMRKNKARRTNALKAIHGKIISLHKLRYLDVAMAWYKPSTKFGKGGWMKVGRSESMVAQ